MCTLKQEKADWDTAKRVLGESGFMRSLLEFDKDHIPDAVMRRLRKYTDSPDFTPEAVAKQSKAAQSLCMWCRAMEVYDRIAKVLLLKLRQYLPSYHSWRKPHLAPCQPISVHSFCSHCLTSTIQQFSITNDNSVQLLQHLTAVCLWSLQTS